MSDKSRSDEQREAEEYLVDELEKKLGYPLKRNHDLSVPDTDGAYICPDFYSKEHHVMGEVFAHIGKPKKTQDNKIANDILKMLLYDEKTGIKHTKILVVCDEAEARKLKGKSALAASIQTFGIEVVRIDLCDVLREKVLAAQSRQRMVNV